MIRVLRICSAAWDLIKNVCCACKGHTEELARNECKRYVSPYGVAQIYAALNHNEQTYRWLETAYHDHSVWMSYLAVDPVFDSIRSEEHFRDLLRRVGLD